MDRLESALKNTMSCVPRKRGDGPPATGTMRRPKKCSPQARGWTADFQLNGETIKGVPRKRGDGPLIPPVGARKTKCSPQARGWTERIARETDVDDVFPASAGMDRL